MVAKVTKLTDAAAARSYYEADDYWSREAAGQWQGRAARALGLEGEVDPDEFMTLLKGELPDGSQLGTTRKGLREHTPGFDLTMSAPKSVSIMGLVTGDRRVIDAHARAVEIAMDYAERHAGVTRIRRGETVEQVATRKLAYAQFLHVTARETEAGTPAPQIHTHNVVLNMTQDDEGNWRSLDARDLLKLQKHVGTVYRTELAAELRQLGYGVTVMPDAMFEIDGVPGDVQRAFSERSAQIEAALAARGQTRASATAAEKNLIALQTRAPKRTVDHTTLAATWRGQADGLGFDEQARRALVTQAEARAAARPHLGTIQRMVEADKAVAFAAAKLSERDAVFTAADLEREAAHAARGNATHADTIAAIDRAEHRQTLMIRAAPGKAQGAMAYTTHEAVATERHILALEAAGRGAHEPLAGQINAEAVIAAAELRSAHRWTTGQKQATRELLLSTGAVSGLQGHAGTAKTTTVLATIAETARAKGHEVRALAPTAEAADLLGRAIEAEPATVAAMLNEPSEPVAPGDTAHRVWIVDEASMLSARDTERLLIRAREAKARVILSGDTAQLGSVEAGRAFAQLCEAGMQTPVLNQIVRQTNLQTLKAVEASVASEAAKAFAHLDAGGGAVVELSTDEERHARIAADFAKLSPEDRARTLVLDPTREGRRQLTHTIRAELVRDGTLGLDAITATTLEPVGLTRAERQTAAAYSPGQIVTFRKGSREHQLSRGRAYRVDAADVEAGTVSLLSPQGKTVAWSPARWGEHAEAFTEVEAEFRAGDRIQFTRNNRRAGRLNGNTASVVAIDPERASMMVEMEDGTRQMLDINHLADRYIRPGWVRTIHSAQGATCERVMAHMESFRVNTVNTSSVYVAISRAKAMAALYTDNRAKLTEALGLRDGAQVGALDGAPVAISCRERGAEVGHSMLAGNQRSTMELT